MLLLRHQYWWGRQWWRSSNILICQLTHHGWRINLDCIHKVLERLAAAHHWQQFVIAGVDGDIEANNKDSNNNSSEWGIKVYPNPLSMDATIVPLVHSAKTIVGRDRNNDGWNMWGRYFLDLLNTNVDVWMYSNKGGHCVALKLLMDCVTCMTCQQGSVWWQISTQILPYYVYWKEISRISTWVAVICCISSVILNDRCQRCTKSPKDHQNGSIAVACSYCNCLPEHWWRCHLVQHVLLSMENITHAIFHWTWILHVHNCNGENAAPGGALSPLIKLKIQHNKKRKRSEVLLVALKWIL